MALEVQLLGLYHVAFADGNVPMTDAQLEAGAERDIANYKTWGSAPWQQDDPYYTRMRRTIEAQFDGGNPISILKNYEPAWKPTFSYPPATIYAISYASYKSATTIGYWDNQEAMNYCSTAYGAIVYGHVALPHTFEMARAVFLCSAIAYAGQWSYALGARLVKHSPNDFDIKYVEADNLGISTNPQDLQLAMKYADDLEKLSPGDLRILLLRAHIYVQLAKLNHSIPDAETCAALYRQYEDSEPPGSEDVGQMNIRIAQENQLIHKWAQEAAAGLSVSANGP